MTEPLRLLILGAHPDDADYHAGGLATLYRRAGHVVKMVALTNGEAGHHCDFGAKLAVRRREEAAAAGRVIGAEYVTWDWPDGKLLPSLELRWQVIREIRQFRPDLVLTHRTNDYHPDHRAVGEVVRDASYLVTVPSLVTDAPALRRDPVIAFMPDRFTKPNPLQPDVIVDVTDCVPTVIDMLHCHFSQFYEWLPWNRQVEHMVPPDDAGKKAWLGAWYREIVAANTERYRTEIDQRFGPRATAVQFAEIYEISEYAAPLDESARRRLFWMTV